MQSSIASPTPVQNTTEAQAHSTFGLIVLHLLPGVLATLVYILCAPLATSLGFPTLFALYVPAILTVIAFELGYLLYRGQKHSGRLTLDGAVLYRQPVPWWNYIVFPLVILACGIVLGAIFGVIDNVLLQNFFQWLPDWYRLTNVQDYGTLYPRGVLITMYAFALVLNGLAGPIVEELYFRGYLLPRLGRFGRWAPLINTLLFSLYHFWQPWQFFSRVALVLPLAYIVRWKKNIYIGMVAHCAANLLGTTILFLAWMR